ncbi:hypothetical protein GW17_00013958 [Ensete ventricosum]|uniref:Uncharacterized protein n=1 Tax=Ensete ventricosum TaxID=4639 RepID=A0A444FGX2_ENSVE|nr:hypothetical protein B296_00024864 [Ensete ventricosum]RWW21860.1 hypothetical protein GW17_00013958 [Ensete ventricosum]RZS10518.1 hypothetical protein BHM03_00041753 [Ensete ventricosum]
MVKKTRSKSCFCRSGEKLSLKRRGGRHCRLEEEEAKADEWQRKPGRGTGGLAMGPGEEEETNDENRSRGGDRGLCLCLEKERGTEGGVTSPTAGGRCWLRKANVRIDLIGVKGE